MIDCEDGEDNYKDSCVVDVKISEVLVKAGGNIHEGIWTGEGKVIDEL